MITFTDYTSALNNSSHDVAVSHGGKLDGRAHAIGIGNFDGVHRGHQALINRVIEYSKSLSVRSLILTFNPHPASFFSGGKHGPTPIYSPEERCELLAHKGIQATLLQRFDEDFASLSPEAFIQEVLVDALAAKAVVVGYDFAFGAKRAGTIDTLRSFGSRLGFEVSVIEAVGTAPQAYSSTWVRTLIANGDVAQAHAVLGRPFHVNGIVTRGYQRGRTLGFPTANLALTSHLCPNPGVYMGWLSWGDSPRIAVISIGTNPTFEVNHKLIHKQSWSVEVHVIQDDVSDSAPLTPSNPYWLDLYNKEVKLWFHSKIRGMKRFEDISELKRYIDLDRNMTRELLSTLPPPSWP